MQVITPVTRRDLRAALRRTWSGRLGDAEFLSRLYDLNALPSTDDRYESMLGDVYQHTENNDDWADDWIFEDSRLGLDNDERLLRLIAETLHPEVVADRVDATALAANLNALLLPDGVELFPASAMSGRPVFSWRQTVPRTVPTGEFPSSLIAGLSQIVPELTTSTGIDSMFEVEDFPRPDNLGVLNKPEKVKAWLRTAQAHADFDHWARLAKVLQPILEDTSRFQEETKAQIHAVLAKRGITYLTGGMFTTTPQVELAGLPASAPPARETWTEIGSGGFGVVFRAKDPKLEIDFALKVFEPYPGLSYADARARFTREAGLLFRLRHENIVRVYDAGDLPDGRPFIKMEFFDGLNLNKAREQRPFSAENAVMIVGKVAAAIEHAHSRSIIHRDIKPSNILLSTDHEVRLIDFGLGILVEEAINRARLTKTTDHFGDAFTAPELLENAKCTDPAVDIYSLGAVWFWLHAGHTPKGVGADVEINDFDLAPQLRKLLHASLLSSGKDRPTAKALRDSLRDWWSRNRGR